MTKKQLLKKLEKIPDNVDIILSSDEEGNDFGILFSIEQDENNNVILWPATGTVEMDDDFDDWGM